MIRKGQVLGISRQNLYGQAWVFAALLQVAWLFRILTDAQSGFDHRRCNTSRKITSSEMERLTLPLLSSTANWTCSSSSVRQWCWASIDACISQMRVWAGTRQCGSRRARDRPDAAHFARAVSCYSA